MRTTTTGFLAFALVVAVATASAQPICLDGDADADTICDGADNCPADPNTDQSDVDSDGVGDVCDPVDAVMFQSKVTLKTGKLGLRGQAKAYVQMIPPTAPIDPSNGLSVTVRDGGVSTVSASWSEADCVLSHGAVRCTTPDRAARLIMKQTSSVPGYYRFRTRVNSVAAVTSFVAPGTVELTIGDLTHQGVGTICTAKTRAMTCRYPPP